MAQRASKSVWAERVQAWKDSGLTPADFAHSRGLNPSTLSWWITRLKREPAPHFVQLLPRPATKVASRPLLVEVGAARIVVEQGFDPALLSAVVSAIGGAR